MLDPKGMEKYLPFTRRPRSETPNVVLPLVIFIEQTNERGKAEAALAGLQVESNGPPRTYRSAKHHEVPCRDDQEVLDIIAERIRQARARLAQT